MIRPFAADDLQDLLEVWYEASVIAHPFLDETFLTWERRQIIERWLPMAETLVDERDGRVVGFVSMIGSEVGAIFVRPGYQGSGIGRALLDRVRAEHPVLELDVFEKNDIGRRFYRGYGFRVTGSHIHEATGEVELRLRLDRPAHDDT